ncbi:uncharacterized protein LOC121259646 [Juglans microcarpa x Juglans regia]|uniref:uncharacterized protein LOC121259646 n=1 Tax=Juglans microcarpa x Juglans regia TaxID=2249226 RepID=UPI001B7EFC75|nr:uncharacterized protein LOC121259646 [Juglans microcarpa x Juglans regia]XP_041017235.1 uncharacterized protein LOC121259646 [Juglans microcarpa x Juglans regia]XP_041017236.1 uncharacterized protein LOC121259646 [Juglans microcarpa x Juglans regia]
MIVMMCPVHCFDQVQLYYDQSEKFNAVFALVLVAVAIVVRVGFFSGGKDWLVGVGGHLGRAQASRVTGIPGSRLRSPFSLLVAGGVGLANVALLELQNTTSTIASSIGSFSINNMYFACRQQHSPRPHREKNSRAKTWR